MNIIEKLGITPGPWVKDYGGTIGHIKCIAPNKQGFTPTVARYDMCASFIQQDNQKANGRMIAAAPEMLEALIDLARRKEYAAYNAYMENGWGDESEKKAVAEIKPYTDIIEKATGLEWEKIKEL